MTEKIHITDLIEETHKTKCPKPEDRALIPWKKKKRETFLGKLRTRLTSFLKAAFHTRKPIGFRALNFYRIIRESLVRFYLARTVATLPLDRDSLTIYRQPVPLILLKTAIVAFISYWLYGLYPLLGKWLKIGFDFFKLDEIYTFKFPGQSFFDTLAMYLILFVIAYHGIYFLYHELVALLSVLVVNEAEDKVYIVRNTLVRKALHVFSIPDIALVILRQNVLARIFGLGSIAIEKKSGDLVEIKSVAGARKAVQLLSRARQKNRKSRDKRL